MINILQNLKYLHQEAKKGFAETFADTYEQALETSFKCFLEQEYNDKDPLNKARAEFKESSYYFLTLQEFEKYKLEALRDFKNDIQKELIKFIDQTENIDDLREAKKIYDSIIKIVDSNQLKFDDDCKLVLFN